MDFGWNLDLAYSRNAQLLGNDNACYKVCQYLITRSKEAKHFSIWKKTWKMFLPMASVANITHAMLHKRVSISLVSRKKLSLGTSTKYAKTLVNDLRE